MIVYGSLATASERTASLEKYNYNSHNTTEYDNIVVVLCLQMRITLKL